MRYMVIACEVLTREVCHCVARTPHIIDLQFTAKGSHDDPAYLRRIVQEKVDACESSDVHYDAVLLCFGLCGNALDGVKAGSIPLVIPRAHDCCTLFLGSKERFASHFAGKESTPFQAAGYIERGGSRVREAGGVVDKAGLNTGYAEYVEKYGEENAKTIWETLHPAAEATAEHNEVVFIDVPETRFLGYGDACKRQAEGEGREFVQLQGSIRLIENLLFGNWPDDEFLVVKPHNRISGVYDWDRVVQETSDGDS